MKIASTLSLLLAAITTVSAMPLEAGNNALEARTIVESGSFEIDEGALEKRAAHILLTNNLPNPLSYQLNDGGERHTLAEHKSVTLPYPAVNAAGFKIYLRHVGGNDFFLAEYAVGNQSGGGTKVFYNFSVAGSASDPFLHQPKSLIPLSNKGKPGFNCIEIHCPAGSDKSCAAQNGEKDLVQRAGSFPVGSCPAATNIHVVMGPTS